MAQAENRECYNGQEQRQPVPFKGHNSHHTPPVALQLWGLHQGSSTHPQVPGTMHKCAQWGGNGHALTNHRHRPLLPPRGQHGRHQQSSQGGRRLSSSSPNNPALPPALFYALELLHQIPPLPVSSPEIITEPCSFLLVQELL